MSRVRPMSKAAGRLLLLCNIPQRDVARALAVTLPTVSAISASIVPDAGLDGDNLNRVIDRFEVEVGTTDADTLRRLLVEAAALAVEKVRSVVNQATWNRVAVALKPIFAHGDIGAV